MQGEYSEKLYVPDKCKIVSEAGLLMVTWQLEDGFKVNLCVIENNV